MSELIVHHRFNPTSGNKAILVRESGWKPHKLRLRGNHSIGFDTGANGIINLHVPPGMRIVDDPDRITSTDLSFKPKDLTLRPGQQVTLRFYHGRVLHTVGYLPPDDAKHAASNALKRAKVYSY